MPQPGQLETAQRRSLITHPQRSSYHEIGWGERRMDLRFSPWMPTIRRYETDQDHSRRFVLQTLIGCFVARVLISLLTFGRWLFKASRVDSPLWDVFRTRPCKAKVWNHSRLDITIIFAIINAFLTKKEYLERVNGVPMISTRASPMNLLQSRIFRDLFWQIRP